MLVVQDIEVSYGAVAAVKGISFNVGKGELVTIIGANGAGKSTTLNAIMGLVPITAGDMLMKGQTLTRVSVENRVGLGMSYSPEGRRVFKSLSVLENLKAGGTTLSKDVAAERIDRVMAHFPTLQERRDQVSGTLSGGEQQMLAIARALVSDPEFLILDEPSLGLAPKIVSQVFEIISELRGYGVTILLVEQNISKSLAVADRAYVMELGLIVKSGFAAELADDPEIHDSYLGTAG
ncbi:MAG: ABC transporter ATP-binding protein [Alphaproteobacteria bacterium]|jgi:branched-chain amino acid transport system ATP-binding protein|nr:ABC transporter ATP-binding protein [Alphaproteobacteria bacterium]MBT4020293.1 ABC transporter ATP-binding protein [Alphaproteobacteria bacterium]MBT7744565.1 ABC transporter ATP-binding protein [Alphaproteobacteria bacterium]